MIQELIIGFVAILIGLSLIGPISDIIGATGAESTGAAYSCAAGSYLANTSSWGATVCRLVPGFFALGIMGIGVAIVLSVFRRAGIGG